MFEEEDFVMIDKRFRFMKRDKMMNSANRNGYSTISGAIYGLYNDKKMSCKEVAKEMGVSYNAMFQFMDRHGFDRRPPGGRNRVKLSSIDVGEIRKLLNHENNSEIAEKFGVTSVCISQLRCGKTHKEIRT